MTQSHHNILQYNNKNKLEAWGLKHQTTKSLQQQKKHRQIKQRQELDKMVSG